MSPSGTHPSGSRPSGFNSSEPSPSLARDLSESELQHLADTQEAEALLFQYVVTSAGQLETPLVILKKLANNLGDPQRLPATKILQTAVAHPLAHPLSTLIAMEGILEDTFEDSAASFEEELASSAQKGHSTPWISLETAEGPKGVDDDFPISPTPLSDTSLQTKPLVERKKQRIFPVGKIFFIGLAIIYGFMVFKTGELSPFAIIENIKTQREAHLHSPLPPQVAKEQEDSKSAQSSQTVLNGKPIDPTKTQANTEFKGNTPSSSNSQSQEQGQSDSLPPLSSGAPQESPLRTPHQPEALSTDTTAEGVEADKNMPTTTEDKDSALTPADKKGLQVPSPLPLGKQDAFRKRPHPGVVSLPGEKPAPTYTYPDE